MGDKNGATAKDIVVSGGGWERGRENEREG